MENADINDYGKIALNYKASKSLYDELLESFEISDVTRIYTIALLRSSYGNVCDRDLRFRYETSFASELYPNVALSEGTICRFLEVLGRKINSLQAFIKNRIEKIDEGSIAVIDGMLKDCTCSISSFTNWSRKSRIKGEQDISLLYAFNSTTDETIAHNIYPGNMLDSTSFSDFVRQYNFSHCIIMGDKGFLTKENLKSLSKYTGYIFPLKRSDNRFKTLELLKYTGTFKHDNDVIEYCKVNKGNNYYYSFKNLSDEIIESKTYMNKVNEDKTNDQEIYQNKRKKFGTIAFILNKDIKPFDVYTMYERRWEIESYFHFYKNIACLNNVRVQDDVSIIGSEFINFLS